MICSNKHFLFNIYFQSHFDILSSQVIKINSRLLIDIDNDIDFDNDNTIGIAINIVTYS